MLLSVIGWKATATEMPPDGRVVLVSGGTAIHRDGKWFSGMEEPYFQRPIEWAVTHWADCPDHKEWIVR